ncbi:MAG: cytochrome ubiquinol oxidase subunit I, partial [Actinobacteria bacterium]
LSTMFIAVPTGVKILNWLATMWGGKLTFSTPMLFAIGLVTMFTIGGLSGVTHAVAPSDTQQTDTYYIVAHFHYVLFGGAVFGLFAGFYYWWPKVFGRMLSEKIGRVNFWLMFVGMNLTFGPMHIIGLDGQPRRMYTYTSNMGFDAWNLVETIGAFILAAGVFAFLVNVVKSIRGPKAPEDPWDARTIEWMTTSPPKPHNFESTIAVAHLDEYWHRKYEEVEEGHGLKQVATYDEVMAAEVPDEHIHMPSPSYWPIVIAFGLPIIAAGVIFNLWLAVIGGLIVFGGLYGLALEPATAPDAGDDHGGHGHDDHEPDGPDAQTTDGDDHVPGDHVPDDHVPDDHEAVAFD